MLQVNDVGVSVSVWSEQVRKAMPKFRQGVPMCACPCNAKVLQGAQVMPMCAHVSAYGGPGCARAKKFKLFEKFR